MKKKITELIIQIVPVMIGVYLGFVVSNWGDLKKRKNQKVVFIKIIKNEIKHNKEKLENIVDYHKILRDSSMFYLNNFSINKPPAFFRGIQTSALLESAYDIGNQTGIISEFEMDNILVLNQLYSTQKEYNEYIKIALAGIINSDFNGKEESIRKILQFVAISMTDIVYKEEYLIAEYDKIQNIIK